MSDTTETPTWNRVAIIGVGLIGGSIGAAILKRRLAAHVVGFGRTQSNLKIAMDGAAITEITTSLETAVSDADLIVVCTPVGVVAEQVRQIAESCTAQAIITDAASTKKGIVDTIEQSFGAKAAGPKFVGGHPMAGGEQSGAANADAELFQNKRVILTKTESTCETALERVTRFWQALGAKVCTMTPELHDRYVAAISHLPHLVASALSTAVYQPALDFAATGWRDTTRIAEGDPGLWRQIMLENRSELLQALDQFETTLSAFRQALEAEDASQLESLLLQGKEHRDALGS